MAATVAALRYCFEPRIPTVPVLSRAGVIDALFPVRRIYCVGQNYEAHAKEMGNTDKKPPFFFGKPQDSIVFPQAIGQAVSVRYPSHCKSYHHEVELVAAIGAAVKPGATAAEALQAVMGYAVGLDMTRRDMQAIAKKEGRPWDLSKGFDDSAILSHLRRATDIGHPSSGAITLEVNGVVKQSGDIKELIWDVGGQIAALSSFVDLQAGDLIYTGTPSGVGAVEVGDRMRASVAGVGTLEVVVLPPRQLSHL